MVGLEFVAVADPAQALKIFTSVGIPCLQFPDEARRHDVVYVASRTRLCQVRPARLDFTLSAQALKPMFAPLSPNRSSPRPSRVYSLPPHWPFLRTETRSTETAPPVTVGAVTAVNCSQDFGSFVATIRASHYI